MNGHSGRGDFWGERSGGVLSRGNRETEGKNPRQGALPMPLSTI